MAKYKVLSTKKLDPWLIEQANQKGIEIIVHEFISVKHFPGRPIIDRLRNFSAESGLNIVVTSANAVEALHSYREVDETSHKSNWSIFCLSAKTKQAVLKAGFQEKDIAGEAENATELANKIIDARIVELVFICGNRRRDELPKLLAAANVKVHEIIAYETVEIPSATAIDFDGLLFFSPSGVQSFFSSNQLKNNAVCFAIGPTTAGSIATFTKNKIINSSAPDPATMLEVVIEHFNQKISGELA